MPALRWQVAEDVDLGMIQRAALEKKARKQSYQCTPGNFLAQLPEAGGGRASCLKSGELRSILQSKQFCTKDGFFSLKATFANEGVIKVRTVGTAEWVGRPEDIDQLEQELKIHKETRTSPSGLSGARKRTNRTKERELVRPSVSPLGERTDVSIPVNSTINEGEDK
jgi:hypothetical protein